MFIFFNLLYFFIGIASIYVYIFLQMIMVPKNNNSYPSMTLGSFSCQEKFYPPLSF